MEIRQLEFFSAAADTGNFTRAAANQHVTESGLQKQIRSLERELGLTLFSRSGRSVRLTSDGKQLLTKVQSMLSAADDIRNLARNLEAGTEGLITIGCYPVHVIRFLGPLIGEFKKQHPEIRVRLGGHPGDQVVEGRHDLYDAMFSGKTDLVIGSTKAAGASSMLAYKTNGVAILPPSHPAIGSPNISITQLRDEPLLCLPRGIWFRQSLENACLKAGFRPLIELETTVESILALSRASYGIGAFSDDNVYAIKDRNYPTIMDIDGNPLEEIQWLHWRSDQELSHASQTFLDFVKDSAKRAI